MPDREHYSRDEVLLMLDGPTAVTDLPGGGVMVVRGGVVGLGWSRAEAAADWRQEFLEVIARPKHPPTFPGDTEMHPAFDSPAEEHPPA